MLKTIILDEYSIFFNEFEKNRDYNVTISFRPTGDYINAWGKDDAEIVIPYTFGLVDTTINDQDYFCTILFDDKVKNIADRPNILFAFFTKKLDKPKTEITPTEPAKMTQLIDEKIPIGFRGIRSPSGNSYINIGDNIVEIVADGSKTTFTKNKITDHGSQQVEHDLPTKSQGGLFTQTGFLHFIPNLFGAMPRYLPDIMLIFQVAKKLEVVKNLIKDMDKENV